MRDVSAEATRTTEFRAKEIMMADINRLSNESAITTAQSFARAMVVGDAATLERLITADFTYTHSSARVEPANELIATVRNGRKNPRMDFENFRVRAYPGMALVSGLNHMHTSTDKKFDAHFSLVLVTIDGSWRVLAYHSTALPEG